MKKIATLLVFVLAFSANAQVKNRMAMQRGKNLTPAQRATISAKRLTLALDLTKDQTAKVTALFTTQAEARANAMAKMKKDMAAKGGRMSRGSFENMNAALDKRIDFNANMKKILSADQFEKFKKIEKGMKKRVANRMKKGRKRNK